RRPDHRAARPRAGGTRPALHIGAAAATSAAAVTARTTAPSDSNGGAPVDMPSRCRASTPYALPIAVPATALTSAARTASAAIERRAPARLTPNARSRAIRSEEHTSELQSRFELV